MTENEIAREVVDAALKVHKTLGPGLLEKPYHECLFYELHKRGLRIVNEKWMPLVYEDLYIDHAFKIDLVVEDKVIVEVKSVSEIAGIHMAQTLTYLKVGGYKLGLLLNFNVEMMRDGIKRVILGKVR
ncbi:MAG: GxxExxY protein [Bacteroidales bacterium]|nr:GxxExxY protein [Bacteroidales bacterium]